MTSLKSCRPFLKWPGGKYLLAPLIREHLPKSSILAEPFVGAGAIFLNTEFKHYHLNDINQDLITLFETLKEHGEAYISEAQKLFCKKNNQSAYYYRLREGFNQSTCPMERSLLFLYLNRHGFNGLCRYNQQGIYNVPFGRYDKPFFPEEALYTFYEKSQRATFYCLGFEEFLKKMKKNTVIYCDPPYYPLNQTSYFTNYHHQPFTLESQQRLADLAEQLKKRNIRTLISNHDTPAVRALYETADIISFEVGRTISSQGATRKRVRELLALF